MRKAKSNKNESCGENIRVKTNGSFITVKMTVKYLDEPESMRGLMLVVFEKTEPAATRNETAPSDDAVIDAFDATDQVRQMKRELDEAKISLQVTIEELETSNEELKSSNEELQSTNEELQSANEELETSKEEQQSLNEELVTVNSELQGKLEEFSRTNNDMKNLLDSIDVPTIFVDNHLHIKRFTVRAADLFNLIPSDVGRPITDISHNLEYDNIFVDIQKVIATLQQIKAEVKTRENTWYSMRVSPYRTAEDSIDGAVITFLDITEQKQSTRKLNEILLNETIVNTLREPLLVLDKDLKVLSANRSFYTKFKVSPKNTTGVRDLRSGKPAVGHTRFANGAGRYPFPRSILRGL